MKEIGTLGAMGMTGKQLLRLFFLEALFISMAGAIVGILGGSALTGYLGKVGFSAMADAMRGMDTAMGLSFDHLPCSEFQVNHRGFPVLSGCYRSGHVVAVQTGGKDNAG